MNKIDTVGMTTEDLKSVAYFHRIVKNYHRMKNILKVKEK